MIRLITITITKTLDPDFLLGRETAHMDEDTLRKMALAMVQSEPDVVLDNASWTVDVETNR